MLFLVVDDSPTITLALRRALEREGVDGSTIHTASSGEEALAMFEVLEPDVVFLDVQMDGIDGATTADEMARIDPEPNVIVITGMGADDERVRRMVAGGAFAVLEKPIHAEDVSDCLNLVDREFSGAGRIR